MYLAVIIFSIICSSMLSAVDGVLDPTFNPGSAFSPSQPGTVITDFGNGEDTAYAVLIQPADQKIVLVGQVRNAAVENVFGLARYNPDGSLDSSFGIGGTVITTQFSGSTNSGAIAAVLQPDGKIVAAGLALNTISGFNEFAVARYNTDGTLDTSFNGTGLVTTATPGGNAEAQAVMILPGGTIVVGGFGFSGLTSVFTLASYTTTGLLIGTVQQTPISNSSSSFINALALDPVTGFLIATGGAVMTAAPAVPRFATARYSNPTLGILDATFNPGGSISTQTQAGVVVTAMPSDGAATPSLGIAVAVQPDQKILVGGTVNFFIGSGFVRYLPDGSLDTAFGPTGGRIVLPFTGVGGFDAVYEILLQADGKIIVAGTTNSQPGNAPQFFVGRYLTTGFVDPTFNPGSAVTGFNFTSVGGMISEAFAATLQADQKIILVGDVTDVPGGNFNFAAARYTNTVVSPVPPCPLLQTPRSDIIQAIMSKYCIC